MSGLPPIPPRPNRTNARSPAPAPAGSGNGSTLGSDMPIIPPRPKRRIDRSASPSKSQTSSTEEPNISVPSIDNPTQDISNLVALEPPSLPPVTLEIPAMSAREEQGQEEELDPVPEIGSVPDDLELRAPQPQVPRNSETEETQKLAAITRTDSAGAAELGLEEGIEQEKSAAPQPPKLQAETHTAIMESLGELETLNETEDQLERSDFAVEGTDEVLRKPVEVNKDGAAYAPTSKDDAAAGSPASRHDAGEEDPTAETKESTNKEDDSTHHGATQASGTTTDSDEPKTLHVEFTTLAAPDDNLHVGTSGVQLVGTAADDKKSIRDTALSSDTEASGEQGTSVPELKTQERDEEINKEEQEPKSGTDTNEVDEILGEPAEPVTLAELKRESAIIYSSDSNNGSPPDAPAASHEPIQTDKNEVDEILGEPAEPVTLAELEKESAIIDSSESKSGSPPEVAQAPQSSLDTVSDVKGGQIDTHLPDERPTTGAVAFHQEKQAEGIPLSYEEGRATTGVASHIKPAIPPRPAKKVSDPNSKPIPVPILPQVDGPIPAPAPEDRSPTLPAGPKPPVPLASKPAIPPRPARPPRPVKKDSLNGSEGAPLTNVSSASSARSLFEAGGPEAVAAAKAKPKPPVPSRPVGSKIAALQGGFLSELNKKLKLGPPAPAKDEPEEEVKEEVKEAKPLADARKGRARGPARRAPAKVEKIKEASPKPAATPALAAQSFSFSAPITVWEASPGDGDIKLPSGASTPKSGEIGKGKEPEAVGKNDPSSRTEPKPEIVEEALKVTPQDTEDLQEAKEEIKATTPPATEVPQQQEAESSSSTWAGTTALGAVAMSVQDVIAETAFKASKTIKDFTEGEEHVLSDVEDKDSPPASDVDSVSASPSEEEPLVVESTTPSESDLPVARPFALPQHPSETDNPPSLMSSEAPTMSEHPAIEAAAASLAAPENETVPLGAVSEGIPSAEPLKEGAGQVLVPATAPTGAEDGKGEVEQVEVKRVESVEGEKEDDEEKAAVKLE